MTAYNLRSLLIAAIVLSNCIAWTASRHHYIHNIHGHRSRHRRQGAGLYLASSYVIPGKDGEGKSDGWGEWGEVSPCSRTCGGGVASQKRICLKFGPDGQPQCRGGDTKYFSCHTQDCPEDSRDFRAEQCAEFNDKDFRGAKYNWVPYTRAVNPCELNCMPHGERFYYRHKPKVIDGTRCTDDSFDVCVDGTCQPVGCDMMLGSTAREDKCRKCRGNGVNCHTNMGIIDTQDLLAGYNDVLLIPAGATTIVIEEIRPSSNYLALRNNNGTFYLNGYYHIDFPRTMMIAGALWTYESSHIALASPDKLKCLGPINESLYLSILLQEKNVGVQYEYSLPSDQAPPTDKKYSWVHEQFTPCSVSCGGGIQTRNVTCRTSEELDVVDDNLCDEGLKPATNQTCNNDACPAEWVEGAWGECSKRCGKDGERRREVTCQKIIANGFQSIVADRECIDLHGPKPHRSEECNTDAPCPTWFIGRWKACDKLCDEGKQTRQVVCHQRKEGRVEILDDIECEETKPETEKPCLLAICEGVDWVTSQWFGCDTCLSTSRTRQAQCVSRVSRNVINETLCAYHPKPVVEEKCDKDKLPKCEVQWYATQWSKCSVECGKGSQTRRVFCGLFDGDSVLEVEDDKCANQTKYNVTKPCEVPPEKCPSQWYAGPWSECTERCGGGVQYSKVLCLRGNETSDDCVGDTAPDSTQLCNQQPCNPDEVMPVDPKAPPIMEDYEDLPECEEDDYPEVGVEADTLSTMEGMLSDSPYTVSYAEPESSLFTETGSGFGSSLTTDDLEGSGEILLNLKNTTDFDYDYTEGSGSSGTDTTFTEDGILTSVETDSTESTLTDTTESMESTITDLATGETSSTESTITEETSLSGSTESTITDSVSITKETGLTDTTITYGESASEVAKSMETESSSLSEETGSTEPPGTDASSVSEESGSTVSTITDESTSLGSTESTKTEGISSSSETKFTESTSDSTGSTDSSITDMSSESEQTDITESTVTDTSSISQETASTESPITESSSESEETGSTETTLTDMSSLSSSSESTITEETSSSSGTVSTESTITNEMSTSSETASASTITDKTSDETGSTETTITSESSTPSDTSTTATESSMTDKILTSSESSTYSTIIESTEGVTTITDESVSTSSDDDTESTSISQASTNTEMSSTTEGATTDETSTVETSTGSTPSSSTEEIGTESTSISSESSGTTSSLESSESSTTQTPLESTTEVTSSSVSSTDESTEISGSTTTSEPESTTSEFGSSQQTDESTEISGSTTTSEPISTTDMTTGASLSTESTEESISSTTSVTLSTEETEELLSTTKGVSEATWIFTTLRPKKPRMCKPRKHCKYSKFGCCPDKITAAKGPFEEGCKIARTCKETISGCCPDGVTPARGNDYKDCPVTPCEETLFGCCESDNKTAANGNDQEGCPPPPPPCASSIYGCCADEETEATGPDSEGCPESETTMSSTEFETTSETEIDTSTETKTDTMETSTTPEYLSGSTESASTEPSSTMTVSSTIQEGCAGSEFGCCQDNMTTATGPGGQGCSCNTTEFGCCPDGVSPAENENKGGCQDACSQFAYGCCEDGQTPAHGPNFEGCCLNTAYGCCPDNIRPANGPHLEGCECNSSQYGCCPDNVTSAQGPHNEGCGCQYTDFGCCPDRHTPASGPANEGCGCHTFQFGCCPDGISIAQGPQKQGCHCRYSSYGCCGDDQTPAAGPNGAGCDCAASKYGCCPDGQSEAAGPKFLGCTDVPEDKQAVCSLSTDPGPCFNFTAMWFFDLTYGGCSRFWYGGCEGNGNKFASKEDCEDVCVQPAPKDACKLPSVRGPCDANHVRWYYNSTREQCIPFRYGGCLGNDNNFDSRELCQKQCEPDRTTDACNMPIEEGPCAGNFSRWGFNSKSRTCEPFTWGGCEGNSNRFKTEAACEMRCNPPGVPKPECSEPQESGKCSNKEALWSFSQSENRCLPFYYTGCGGNNNKFNSRETCEQFCPSAYVPEKCTLPAEVGECSEYRTNWFYDTTNKRCRTFYYGGCGGNENNFVTEAECENACTEVVITTTTIMPQTRPVQQPEPQPQPEPSYTAICFYEVDQGGRCSVANEETRYAYDSALGKCVTFHYLGCGGNQNNFPTEEHCAYYCNQVQDICQLPMLSGPCDASVMSWFYDPSTDSCSQFTYGGCEGNANRFESREACESRCKTGPAVQTTQITTVTTIAPTTLDQRKLDQIPAPCRITAALEECRSAGVVWFFDPEQRICMPYVNENQGLNCRHTATFESQEACERRCGAFREIDVCAQPVDPGPCTTLVTKVYFDQESRTCKQFLYSGCLGGANRFSSIEECSQICKAATDVCSMQPEQGDCNYYFKQWFYDTSLDKCSEFVYTGCGGNENRFETRQDCEARCKAPTTLTITTLAVPVAPPEPQREKCTKPSSLSPCGRNRTIFFYDSNTRSCLTGEFGECGHPNSYSSEEECERQCGAFRDIDVCQAPLDPGPCRKPIQKIYFDVLSGTCQPFTYGGCAGGPNRFSSINECEEICGNSGPAPECLQDLDIGYATGCPAPTVPRYRYSTTSGDCILFVYEGCGGNDNNFPTYEQCRQNCIPFEIKDCDSYEQECAVLTCEFGVVRSSAPGGCESCSCVDQATHCEQYTQECDALVCPYGINRIPDNGCERCMCHEDPCSSENCSAKEVCISTVYIDQETQEQKYTARCVVNDDLNEIPDCSRFQEECSNLRCEFGMQHMRTADGCQRCECVTVEIDCAPLEEECKNVKCNYGMERTTGVDGCVRCKCTEHPCASITCPDGDRCVVDAYRDPLTQEPKYSADCRTVMKPGDCPMEEPSMNEGTCRQECHDDAECRGIGKCCTQGCSKLCMLPATPTTQLPRIFTTTYAPNIPAAPQALPPPEPEIAASEGGKATLRCLFHGNPPPKITWRRGEITIDGNVGRYRLLSDGTLEIVSLYRNDTGVYICVADNGLGVATQEINLIVNVPVIAHVSTTSSTLNIGAELHLACEVDGFPEPSVQWTKDGVVIEPNDRISISGNTIISRLVITRVAVNDSGVYGCNANNGYTSHNDTAQINVQQITVPAKCTDNPYFAKCDLIVRSKYCHHQYYSKFCCKSCVEAGQLDPHIAELQADQPYRRK